MTAEMTAETAAALRAPFATEEIGKLPKITCGDCRNSATKDCKQHKKSKCAECRNWITSQHMHIDFVGHAETTDRLLQVDPAWGWEPVAWAPEGTPHMDAFGGLWIRLTVAGVPRYGYGHADGKRGADAIKEAIGDAIRNAAMRFGVALDLWGAKFSHTAEEEPAKRRRRKPDEPDSAADPAPDAQPEPRTGPVTQSQHKTMRALWAALGYQGTDQREVRLAISAKLLGLDELNTSAALTAAQAELLIDKLRARIEANAASPQTVAAS